LKKLFLLFLIVMMPNAIYYVQVPTVFVTLPNTGIASQTCSMVYPPFNPAQNTYVPLTRVNMMNVEQTANWIRTIASSKGWSNLEYAESFKKENINGFGLQYLNNQRLVHLGVRDSGHRHVILSTIRSLYPLASPYLNSDEGSSASDSGCANSDHEISHSEGCNPYVDSETGCSSHSSTGYSMSTTSSVSRSWSRTDYEMDKSNMPISRACRTVVSSRSNSMSESKNVSFTRRKPGNSRKLLVTIDSNQDDDHKTIIWNRFRELNIPLVDIYNLVGKKNVYVLVFVDSIKAEEALSRSAEINFQIRWKWADRPAPKSPKPFKSLRNLKILSGKSLYKSQHTGWLLKDTVVSVNQLKGNRARLIEENDDGSVDVIGWVSTNIAGEQCLIPVGEA